MKRTLADLLAYGIQYLRSPTATFFTLVFPVLLILVFGGVFGSPEDVSVELHVQDLDGSDLSHALVQSLEQTGVLNVVEVPQDQDLEAYVRERSVTAALLIPEGFGSNVTRALGGDPGARPQVILLGDPSSSAFQTVQGAVLAAVTTYNFALSDASPVVAVDIRSVAAEAFTFLDFFIPGVIGITVLTPLFATSTTYAEYRERHYLKLLATTPLRKWEWLLSRTLWLLGLTFLSTLLMLAVARAAFGTAMALTPIAAAFIVSGTVLFVSLGMLLGSVAKDVEAANALANVVYFPMMFLSGAFWPVEIMPEYVQAISRVLPLTYFNDGMRDTLVLGNTSGALTNLAIITVLALLTFIIAARVVRWRAE
jgi:ABC-2 type transport system permease protein